MLKGFFEIVSVAKCIEVLRGFAPLAGEAAPIDACLDRVLATEVVSSENLPLVNRSCMDGYAVRAEDLFGASESNAPYLQLAGSVHIDSLPEFSIEPGQCAAITTGGTLPEGANAVLMVEHSDDLGAGFIEAQRSLAPGDNVMFAGEDAARGKAVLPAGRRLGVPELGLLAALGIAEVEVARRPVVGVLSTGDELVPLESTPKPGQVRDVNSLALSCLLRQAGATPKSYGLVPDTLEQLTDAMHKALNECDAVLVSGGSSIGVRDLTTTAITSLPDAEILLHGVALSPGKPTIVARAAGKPILGLPGQVASAQVVMLVLGQPLMRHLAGDATAFDENKRCVRPAVLAQNLASKQGREDYVRVRLEHRGEQLPTAWPRLGKSGLLRTLVEADGLVRVPAESEGIAKGAQVEVWLL